MGRQGALSRRPAIIQFYLWADKERVMDAAEGLALILPIAFLYGRRTPPAGRLY